MRNCQDTFKTRKQSFISVFSICMTAPLIPKNLDSLTREFQTDVLTYYGEELQNTDCFE